jgi:hypothetical protein
MNPKLSRIPKYYFAIVLAVLLVVGIALATVSYSKRSKDKGKEISKSGDKTSPTPEPTTPPIPTKIPDAYKEYQDTNLHIKFRYPSNFEISQSEGNAKLENVDTSFKALQISDKKGNKLNIKRIYGDPKTFRYYNSLDKISEVRRTFNGTLVVKIKNGTDTNQTYNTFYDIQSPQYLRYSSHPKFGIYTDYFPLETETLDDSKWEVELERADVAQDDAEFDKIVQSLQYMSDFAVKNPEGWKTYKDESLGFEFAYPTDWEIRIPCGKTENPHPMCDGPQDFAELYGPNNNGSFNIRGGNEGGDYTCNQDYNEVYNSSWKNLSEKHTYINGVKVRYFDGKSYAYDPSGKRGPLINQQYLLVQAGSACYEIYTSNNTDPKVQEMTNNILKSLKFSNRSFGNYDDKYEVSIPKTAFVENVDTKKADGAYTYGLCSHIYYKSGYITIQSPKAKDYKQIECLTNVDKTISKDTEITIGKKKYPSKDYSLKAPLEKDTKPYELFVVTLENGQTIEFGSLQSYPNYEGYAEMRGELMKVLESYKVTTY